MSKPVLANVGDFYGIHSGFGNVGYHIYSRIKDKYDIHQMAISYAGDYSPLQKDFKFYTTGKHIYGFDKFKRFIQIIKPDIVTVTQDPWIANEYATQLSEIGYTKPSVLYCPVDSDGLSKEYVNVLNLYSHVVTYTEWAKQQLLSAGLTTECSVAAHGVDTSLFYPDDKAQIRAMFDGWPQEARDGYIVTYVAQNSARKRVDLYIYVIDEWLKRYPHDDVYFLYHGPLQRQGGVDIPKFIEYLDQPSKKCGAKHRLQDRFLITSDDPTFVINREAMRFIYNVTDVYFHVAAVEGFGMPISEAMACKVPVIAPDYSAMAEWCRFDNGDNGVFFIPVDDKPDAVTSQIGTVHKYINIHWAVEALETLYQSSHLRNALGKKGYDLVHQDTFNWDRISEHFDTIFSNLLGGN